jgi:hypothetical protein
MTGSPLGRQRTTQLCVTFHFSNGQALREGSRNADSNIVAQAVRAMRALGHDVVYLGERRPDPGNPHPTLPRARGRVREGVSWSIVICNRIAAYCFSMIWVMLGPKSG